MARKKRSVGKANKRTKDTAGKRLSPEMKRIRETLVNEKAQILEDLIRLKGGSANKSIKDASGDLSGYTFHMADMATDLYDREFSLELAEGERQRLFDLDDAIKRVDAGTYGKCDKCSDPITKQRLKVMPQAQFCLKCQQEQETEKRSGK